MRFYLLSMFSIGRYFLKQLNTLSFPKLVLDDDKFTFSGLLRAIVIIGINGLTNPNPLYFLWNANKTRRFMSEFVFLSNIHPPLICYYLCDVSRPVQFSMQLDSLWCFIIIPGAQIPRKKTSSWYTAARHYLRSIQNGILLVDSFYSRFEKVFIEYLLSIQFQMCSVQQLTKVTQPLIEQF